MTAKPDPNTYWVEEGRLLAGDADLSHEIVNLLEGELPEGLGAPGGQDGLERTESLDQQMPVDLVEPGQALLVGDDSRRSFTFQAGLGKLFENLGQTLRLAGLDLDRARSAAGRRRSQGEGRR